MNFVCGSKTGTYLPLQGRLIGCMYAHLGTARRRPLSRLYNSEKNDRIVPDPRFSPLHPHGIHGFHNLLFQDNTDRKVKGNGDH